MSHKIILLAQVTLITDAMFLHVACYIINYKHVRMIIPLNKSHTHTHAHRHTHTHTCVCVCMHVRVYVCMHVWVYVHACVGVISAWLYIKIHSSEPRGQEEAGLRDEPVSYLQVAPL